MAPRPSSSGVVCIAITNLFLFLLSSINHTTTEAAEYSYHFCPNTTTYIPNSTYQTNLNALLSTFSSNATTGGGFYNATVGRNIPDIVYGLFLCRGDISTDDCQDCVTTASKEVVQTYCPKEREVVIWYDVCMLRYSNRSFFSTMNESPAVYLWNTQNITEQVRFNQLLGDTMSELASRASSDVTGVKYFATQSANFINGLQTLYGLVQCTQDLSASECKRCLESAIGRIPSCCSGKQGARVLFPSCNIRYEIYSFYTVEPPAPAPAPTPRLVPPTAPPEPKGPLDHHNNPIYSCRHR